MLYTVVCKEFDLVIEMTDAQRKELSGSLSIIREYVHFSKPNIVPYTGPMTDGLSYDTGRMQIAKVIGVRKLP